MDRPAQHQIAQRAYELWERGGRMHGQDQKYWFAAERELVGAATVVEDRPIGELHSAEQTSAPQVKPATPSASVPPVQPPATTSAQDRPIGEISSAPQASEETKSAKPRAASPRPAGGAGKSKAAASKASADLDAKLDELQTKLAAKASKPRAKKATTNGAGDPKRSQP